MAEIDIRTAAIRGLAGDCDDLVTPWVQEAARVFGDAGGPGAARMGSMLTASALTACLTGWQETYREGTRTMRAVSGNLLGTAGAVAAHDQDAAELYRGDVPDLPVISVNIGG